MDAATARTLVQRELQDESAARWTANQVDQAVNHVLYEYMQSYPKVSSLDATAGLTDTLDYTALAGWAAALWMYCLWAEYPTGNEPATAIRFHEERRGILRVVDSSLPANGETVRAWFAQRRALADVETQHEFALVRGAAGFAALAKSMGTTGAVNVSGWTPKQYRDWGNERVKEFRDWLRQIADEFNFGAPALVWSSNAL